MRFSVAQRAAVIRDRIRATVVKRAPQVMVKVTGGGRGMAAIAAHFRYIAKGGRPPFEDDRGVVNEGKEALHDLACEPPQPAKLQRRVRAWHLTFAMNGGLKGAKRPLERPRMEGLGLARDRVAARRKAG